VGHTKYTNASLLRVLGELQGCFAEYSLFYRVLLQMKPILLIDPTNLSLPTSSPSEFVRPNLHSGLVSDYTSRCVYVYVKTLHPNHMILALECLPGGLCDLNVSVFKS